MVDATAIAAAPHRLHPGDRVGSLVVERLLAIGGFSEVYRARDFERGAEVALKLLRPRADDPTQGRRLLAEARVYDRLAHPRVVALLGVGEHEGAPYLVTELVEGETLAALLAGRRLAPAEVLSILLQVADGLSAAHALGLAHRDLKPSNVMVTPAGEVRLLDFGLARPVAEEALAARSIATAGGVIVGTPAYMSPEQARGEPASLASDVFSFGALIHEVVSGTPAFARSSVAETLRAVLDATPAPLPPSFGRSAAALERLRDRCLARDPAERPADAREVWAALRALDAPPAPAAPGRRASLLALGALGGVGVAVAAVFVLGLRPLPPPPSLGLEALFVEGNAPCLTPSGEHVVYRSAGERELWVASLGGGTPRMVWRDRGDVGAPAVTPDGTAALFDAADRDGVRVVWEVPLAGGQARRVTRGWAPAVAADGQLVACFEDGPDRSYRLVACRRDGADRRVVAALPGPNVPLSVAFHPDGRSVVLTRTDGLRRSELLRVELAGGTASLVAELPGIARPGLALVRGEAAIWPVREALSERAPLQLTPLAGGLSRPLVPLAGVAEHPSLAATGACLVLVERQGTSDLAEIAVDPRSPRPQADLRVIPGTLNASQPRISPDGSRIAFVSAREYLWVLDRTSRFAAPVVATGSAAFNPAWSPEGRRLAYSCVFEGRSDLWVAGADGDAPRRLTDDAPADVHPVWHPNGRHLLFVSDRDGFDDLYRLDLEGGTIARLNRDGALNPAVSADGRLLAFVVPRTLLGPVLRLARLDAGAAIERVLWDMPVRMTAWAGCKPRFSPDGKWLAYDVPREGGGADLWAVPAADGPVPAVRLTDLPFPASTLGWFDWAPDGTVVICLTRSSDRVLLLRDADRWLARALP